MLQWAHHIQEHYGVEPFTFIALYVFFHVVAFYGCLALALLRFKAGRKLAAGVCVAGAIVSYFVPYGYLAMLGHDMPRAAWIGLLLVLVLSSAFLLSKLRTFARKAVAAPKLARSRTSTTRARSAQPPQAYERSVGL
ncbi:MAG: hypothetical protein AB7S38_23425 [Vulcanimicrobiota bacterium]